MCIVTCFDCEGLVIVEDDLWLSVRSDDNVMIKDQWIDEGFVRM